MLEDYWVIAVTCRKALYSSADYIVTALSRRSRHYCVTDAISKVSYTVMEVYCNGTSLYLNHIITRALNAAVSPEQSQFLDIIVSTLILFVRRITDGFKMFAYFRGTLNFNPFEYQHKPGP